MSRYLAVDLGAESGRAILGTLRYGRLEIEELHRFPNIPAQAADGLHWDSRALFSEIERGLAIAGRERGLRLDGIGVDTWGVDFGMIGADGALAAEPMHYRDARNNGMLERTFKAVPREEIFAATGLQFMQFNTLFQLYAMKLVGAPELKASNRLLFMPDLFNYWLSGVAVNELTVASTSQFYDPVGKCWATDLLERLGLPLSILGGIVAPGTRLGPLVESVADRSGLGSVPVFATAGHDTASAVAAVPAEGAGWCYISSGTWSLMGVELEEPVINPRSLALNFTNEIGVSGRVRFLKNITGMWPLQECRREWVKDGVDYTYDDLARMAAAAEPFRSIIDPDGFLLPGNMPSRIAAWCLDSGQPAPRTPGEFSRTILESLALRYKEVLEGLESLTGRAIRVIHIVGGGSRNRMLNQFVADATGRVVVAGPSEATAAGNLLVQAMGAGECSGLDELRAIVRRSLPLSLFEPRTSEGWTEAARRLALMRKTGQDGCA
jgi:rhamnulokinase